MRCTIASTERFVKVPLSRFRGAADQMVPHPWSTSDSHVLCRESGENQNNFRKFHHPTAVSEEVTNGWAGSMITIIHLPLREDG